MQSITLTTDWNQRDYYAGLVKGYIISSLPEVQVVDIMHDIPVFDYKKACIVVKAAYKFFPLHTIHIIGVRGVRKNMPVPPIAAEYNGHWFFGYDNGAFTQIFEDKNIIDLWYLPDNNETTFPEFELLVKPAVELAKGVDIMEIGIKQQFDLSLNISHLPVFTSNSITGTVEYIDSYGNAITNINKTDFERIRAGRNFEIFVSKRNNVISRIHKTYDDTTGELIAIFNMLNMLEIVQMFYKASLSLGINTGSTVFIEFK